jgi:2-iminobutanoate/2-iminopropanoate deaminase
MGQSPERTDMRTTLNPSSIHPPFSAYSHGVAIEAGMRIVFCSGQLGIDAGGNIPSDCEGQARLCFDNIAAVLGEAGMDLSDIVRINAFVTGREHLAGYMAVRNALFPDPFPASTLMIVSGFARQEFVVEIEVVAAGRAEGL